MDDGTEEPDDAFLQTIKTNNEVFAAFRTHRMQNDIAKRMVDDKGELKSFSQFARDVRPYTDHQNRQWLRTEYNTAVIRAHQAADWKQFEAEKDVLPNLEWMPSTSPNPGKDHQTYWGTILPIDHPFWDQHRPGDRWNCKCSLRNTDVEPTLVPEPGTGNDEPNRGLENNPGKDGKLFSDKHPYMPENCSSCPFGNGRLWALAVGRKKNCPDCKRLAKAVSGLDERNDKERRKHIDENRKLYDKLSKDSRYKDVDFDPETGGVKATHRGHNKHPNDKKKYFGNMTGDQLEDEIRELLYKNGHSVIFCDEMKKNKAGNTMPALDMQLDGKKMDIASVTKKKKFYGTQLLHKNKQLRKYNARADVHETADTVCLYFHDPRMYSRRRIEDSINYLKTERRHLYIKNIKCVILRNGKISIVDFRI